MANGKECGRRAYGYNWDDQIFHHCILHDQRPTKNLTDFTNELEAVFGDPTEDCHDLTRVHFPHGSLTASHRIIYKPVYFSHSVFYEVDFSFSEFRDNVYYHKCEFRGKTRFSTGTKFGMSVTFAGSTFFQNTNFDGCKFGTGDGDTNKQADFKLCTFEGKASFRHCWFWCVADFRNVHFNKEVSFNLAKMYRRTLFSTIELMEIEGIQSTTFDGRASFIKTKFLNVSFTRTVFRNEVIFRNTEFLCGSDMRMCKFSAPEKVRFEDIDMSNVQLSGCDISKVDISYVRWAEHRSGRLIRAIVSIGSKLSVPSSLVSILRFLYPTRRKSVFDEQLLSASSEAREYQAVAQLFRRLQANYGESYRYPEAGDFYVGEREMVRKSKGWWRSFICLDIWYKLVSNYGESYRRPLGLLAFILLFIPLLLLHYGVNVDTDSYFVNQVAHEFEGYDSDVVRLKPGIIWEDFSEGVYFDVCIINLKLLWVNRDKMDLYLRFGWQETLIILETLFVASLIALFVLALRRKFKRKSF